MSKLVTIHNRGRESVKLPTVPNFIIRPSDGFPIPVEELSDVQLTKIATAWRQALLAKAAERRARPARD